MCGLFGVYTDNSTLDVQNAVDSLNLQSHRGPDQHDFISVDNVFLGHRRLSIHDLSISGKQPMLFKGVYLTVNGEVYNYKEIRKILSDKYNFQSESDSEVILKAYVEFGVKKLMHIIEGMYAIIIYDSTKEKIFLIRDRVGIKPLHYYFKNGTFAWASELKSIQNFVGEKNLVIDRTALYDFVTYLYVPHPKTIYENVFKLKPGHYIEFDLNEKLRSDKIEQRLYWDIVDFESKNDNDWAKNEYRELLNSSVQQQLDADVEVGAFLSGGLDSSSVVVTASKYRDKLKTFTIGFDDESHDESHKAKLVSDICKTDFFLDKMRAVDASELIRILSFYDEPFGDTSFLPTYRVSEIARDNTTVILSGDGGDELFGGYNWYKSFIQLNTKPKLLDFGLYHSISFKLKSLFHGTKVESLIRRIDMNFALSEYDLYTKLLGGLNRYEKQQIRGELGISEDYDDYWFFRQYEKPEIGGVKNLQYIDFKTYLPCDILTKVDIASMRHSLECRVPFLSTAMCEFAFSLPENMGFNKGELKQIVKDNLKGLLPDEVIYSRKRGFSIPQKKWKSQIKGQGVDMLSQYNKWKSKL